MDEGEFLNQKAKDMSIKELAKAIIIRDKGPQRVVVGDTVRITQDYRFESSDYDGKIGELVEINKEETYQYCVKVKDGNRTWAYEVELVEKKEKPEKPKTKAFARAGLKFVVDTNGDITIKEDFSDKSIQGICDSLPALYDAVELSKKRRKHGKV